MNGHYPYRSGAAAVKIPNAGMMQGVVVPPLLEGRKGQYTANIGQDGIRLLVMEKRTMTAIVEKDKDPNIEGNGNQGQQESGPVGEAQSDGHPHHREQ